MKNSVIRKHYLNLRLWISKRQLPMISYGLFQSPSSESMTQTIHMSRIIIATHLLVLEFSVGALAAG